MDYHELLIRTMNAASEARKRGFENTADAFDEIVESLLQFTNSRAKSMSEKPVNSMPEMLHIH